MKYEKLKRGEYPKGNEHKTCEDGLVCRKCAWLMASNGVIGGLQFCLDVLGGYIDESPCAHEGEKCEEKNTGHGEARRKIIHTNEMMKELAESIILRAKNEL